MSGKLLPLLFVCLISVSHVHGQETKTETYVNPKTKKTEIRTTRLDVDPAFAKVITVEEKSPGGRLHRKTIYKKDITGNWVKSDTCYDDQGRYQNAEVLYFDKDFKYLRGEITRFHKNGKVDVRREETRKENAPALEGMIYTAMELELENYIKKLESDFNTNIDQGKSPCEKDQACADGSEIFAGYSYLNAGGEGENISFPLGVHAAMTYMLTARFGLVGDVSFHSKKENETRIMRAFLMGGMQYHLMREREKRFLIYLRLLAGLAMDRQKYEFGESNSINKSSALAIAAGMGLSYPLNRMFLLTLMPDYILTFFNEESRGNIRLSAGIKINLGCK